MAGCLGCAGAKDVILLNIMRALTGIGGGLMTMGRLCILFTFHFSLFLPPSTMPLILPFSPRSRHLCINRIPHSIPRNVWGVAVTSAIVQNTLRSGLAGALSGLPDKWKVHPRLDLSKVYPRTIADHLPFSFSSGDL
ncbi:MFS drug transporter [Penicillium maclennaniae]|uniref:MFS drug transporter n=1 Tax=Penicillium maclennaniae TaxID=1343394 RepID=UPI002541E488|nr:MFS drug transporter [Penicillium maclennaniae]KAJ5675271.1 MFS drug transporter [Penicillium maclennaniae]